MAWLVEAAFWVFMGCAAAAAAAARLRPGGLSRAASAAGLAAGLALVGAICLQTGRPPLSGPLESLASLALAMAILGWAAQLGPAANPLLAARAWTAAALGLAILVWVPRQVNPDWVLYQYAWPRAFFLCRLASLSLLLSASLAAWSWEGGAAGPQGRRVWLGRSRRLLLSGTAVFLLGEVSGFYWCFAWLGDYWLWNRNFLESTLIFLAATAALHLPARLAARPGALRLAYGLPGLLAVTAYLVHQITEAYL
jgi:hypothetical protein